MTTAGAAGPDPTDHIADRVADSGVGGSPMRGAYRIVTITIVAIVTILAFESMSISTVMPTVGGELSAGGAYGLAFSLMFTSQLFGTVLAAPAVDRSGPIPVTQLGLVLFAIGSVMAGAAPSFVVLLAGRLVAGLGAGLSVVALFVIIGAAYPPALRPKVMAWLSSAWVLPSVLGPVIAAQITERTSWRLVFLIVVPLVVLCFLGLRSARALLDRSMTGLTSQTRADSARAAVLPQEEPGSGVPGPVEDRLEGYRAHVRSAGFGAMVAVGALALQWAGPLLLPVAAGPVAGVVLGAAALVLGYRPLVPAGTLSLRRGLPSLMPARLLLTAGMNGATTFVPLMLVHNRGLSLSQAGALLTVVSLGWTLGSYIQGRDALLGRGSMLVSVGGTLVATALAGMALVAHTGLPTGSFALLMPVMGLGMGLSMSAMSVLVLELAPQADHAFASAASQLSDVLGSVVGIALTGAVYAAIGVGDQAAPAAYVLMWLLCALLALGSAYAGLRTRPREDGRGGYRRRIGTGSPA